jgi:hypothetical protein
VKKITFPRLELLAELVGDKSTAVLLPRDKGGHQECHIMDRRFGGSELDRQ